MSTHLLNIVAGIISLLPSFAKAEGNTMTDTIHLHEVRVAAARRLADTGVEKTTIDSAVLHQNVALSLADILQSNTTLFIKSYGRATESTAEFRGTSPSHTQVVWNGMPINSPMLGTVDFSYIPAYFVDSATLLHGASSITLTGGGLGGAIDLSTHPEYEQGYGLQYVQGIGSFHTFDQFLRFTYSNDRWSSSTRLSYGRSKNDFRYTNYDKMVDETDGNGNIIGHHHPKERNKSGYFDDVNAMQDVYYHDDKGNRIGATLWYGYSMRGLPFLSVDYKDDSDFTNEHQQQTIRSVASWNHQAHKWTLDTRAGYSKQDIAYDYTTSRSNAKVDITHSRSYAQTGFINASFDLYPRSNLQINTKVDLKYAHVRSYDKSPFHIGENYNRGQWEYDLSATARWRPVAPLSIAGVLRQEAYGTDFVPIIPAAFVDVIIFRPWNLILKASVARNYRYPTLNDLYFKPGGNPDLVPEHGFTYDGGLEWNVGGRGWRFKGNATAFDSHIKDWILWTPNTRGFWEPSNVKRVHNYGTEITMNTEVRLGHSQWVLEAGGNYAFTPSLNKGEQINANDASYGKQLCYVPRHSANVNAKLRWRTWALTYNWTYYSERFTTTSNEVGYITGRLIPYYMSGAMLEKSFDTRHMATTLKANVNNLFNTAYVTVLSRPMPGRNFEVFVELRPKLKSHKRPTNEPKN